MPDLVAGYALGALEPDEHRAVEHHRAGCPVCARLVDQAERTAAVLAHLVRPAAPAPDIKAALFARIAQAQQSLPREHHGAAEATSPRAATSNPNLTLPASRGVPAEERIARGTRQRFRLPSLRATGARPAPAGASASTAEAAARPAGADDGASAGRSGWSNWPGPALPVTTTTVPLMLILVVVGGWAMNLYNRANEAAAYQDLWGEMGSFLSSDDGTVYDLQPADGVPPSVTGRVIAEPDAEEAMVMVWGLDQTNPDVTYQVWIERDGGYVLVGDLDLNARGNAQKMVQLDGRLKECRRILVVAQTAGSDAPPLDVLSTTISPQGPAAGGDGTEGDQSIGSLQLDVVQVASNSK
jgi:hypothetical protein